MPDEAQSLMRWSRAGGPDPGAEGEKGRHLSTRTSGSRHDGRRPVAPPMARLQDGETEASLAAARYGEQGEQWQWFTGNMWATLIVPVLTALPALYLWQTGYGAGAAGCCAASAPSAAAVVAPMVTAPVTASVTPAPTVTVPSMPPLASTPVASTPVVDCSALVSGVTVPFALNNARLTAAGCAALDAPRPALARDCLTWRVTPMPMGRRRTTISSP